MKSSKLVGLFLLLACSLSAQLRLRVEGDAKITGQLDLSAPGSNLFIGTDSGESITTGQFNTFIGPAAGAFNTEGGSNTFVGLLSGYSNTSGKENTFIGTGAGIGNTRGDQNTFLGMNAGRSNTTGDANTFVGQNTGFNNTTGRYNTFLGQNAGYNNTAGSNTFLGYFAGYSNTSGRENTFLGESAGRNNTFGGANTFLGTFAGYSNTNGGGNTFLGKFAGYDNTTGNANTFLGYNAGESNMTGSANTFLGSSAGRNNTTGDYNTFLGQNAGFNNTTGNNLTAFGSNATASLLSSGTINNAFVIGSHGLMTSSHSGTLGNISLQKITGYVNIGTASDGRMKKQVQEDVHGLDFILQLRPVSYQVDALKLDQLLRQGMEDLPAGKEEQSAEEKAKAQERRTTYESYLREKSTIRYTGFIAQEVEKAMNDSGFEFSGLVKPEHDQDHYSLRYAEFVVPLVKGMQEQQEVIEGQQQQIDELKNLVHQLLAQQSNQTPVQELDLQRTASLSQNQPNPFQENTVIHYFLPEGSGNARLEVHSVDGKLLSTLPLAQTGEGQVQLRAGRFPAGTYLYSLIVDNQVVESKRMVLTP